MDTFHVDHVGPITATSKGYKHLFVVVDAFSKFTWLFPTKSTSCKDVLDKMEIIAITFRYPRRIVSDRGTAFTATSFKEFGERKGVEHILTSSKRKWTSGTG